MYNSPLQTWAQVVAPSTSNLKFVGSSHQQLEDTIFHVIDLFFLNVMHRVGPLNGQCFEILMEPS